MTYDAVLVARRGLGADELRLASPGFIDAVRWSIYAEKLYDGVPELRAIAEHDPVGLTGQALMDAIATRKAARDLARDIRVDLLLIDEEPTGEVADGG